MKGIIFTENIDKIVDGTKTQTRRVIKPKYSNTHIDWFTNKYGTRLCEIQNEDETTRTKNPNGTTTHKVLAYMELAPRYHKGETVYVKETWGRYRVFNGFSHAYKADYTDSENLEKARKLVGKWLSPMLMPCTEARIFLRITDVRAERLQDISPQDCHAEGIMNDLCAACLKVADCRPQLDVDVFCGNDEQIVEQYADLWDLLNAKRDGGAYRWDKNPWTWAYTFEPVTDKLLPADQQGLRSAAQSALRPAT